MSLSDHVRTLGRGPGRSRSFTQEEAFDAMTAMLTGDAAPEAVGALLMLMRMKGEIPTEIAGFAAAARVALPDLPPVDPDWPTYAAGRPGSCCPRGWWRRRGTASCSMAGTGRVPSFATRCLRSGCRSHLSLRGLHGRWELRGLPMFRLSTSVQVCSASWPCGSGSACRGPKVSKVQSAMSMRDSSVARVRRHGLPLTLPTARRGRPAGWRLHPSPRQDRRAGPGPDQSRAARARRRVAPPRFPGAAAPRAGPRWHSDSAPRRPVDRPARTGFR